MKEIRKFVNNTGLDFGVFWDPIIQAINLDGKMPEELRDVATVEIIEVDGEKRAIINAV
jgi:DNA repair photolyase